MSPSQSIMKEKEMKVIKNGKEGNKTVIFADYMTVYIENLNCPSNDWDE